MGVFTGCCGKNWKPHAYICIIQQSDKLMILNQVFFPGGEGTFFFVVVFLKNGKCELFPYS